MQSQADHLMTGDHVHAQAAIASPLLAADMWMGGVASMNQNVGPACCMLCHQTFPSKGLSNF